MGLAVCNQVNEKVYFSISTISKEAMRENGLTMTMKELKEMARKRAPCFTIITGESHSRGQCRQTNIYKYTDFLPQNG